MKTFKSQLLLLPIGLAGLGWLSAAETPPRSLHQIMVQSVAPQAQIVWNVGNEALDNDGNFDASKVSKAQWDLALKAARQLKVGAHSLANAKRVVVAEPGAKLQDEENEGASDAIAVQRFIDARPQQFRADSRNLESSADKLIAAISARDGTGYSSVANALDEVCESCHKVFWYPQQMKQK